MLSFNKVLLKLCRQVFIEPNFSLNVKHLLVAEKGLRDNSVITLSFLRN